MSKANCTRITMQTIQDHGDSCILSSDKTVKQDSREISSEHKKGRELVSIAQSPPRYRMATIKRRRTPYVEAVLEAYGILPEKRCFESGRQSVDLASEWTTAPFQVKCIVTGFLM